MNVVGRYSHADGAGDDAADELIGEGTMANAKWTSGIRIAVVVGLLAGLMVVPSVAAEAATEHPDLTVTKPGFGSGTVTSNPAGINCGTDCTEPYPLEEFENCIPNPHIPDGEMCTTTESFPQQVTLTATAASGSDFTGWSGGGCSGTAPCEVTMDEDKTVTALFADTQDPVLTIVSPNSGVQRSDFTVTATASDNVEVWYLILDAFQHQDQDESPDFIGRSVDTTAPYQFYMGDIPLIDGPMFVEIEAFDSSHRPSGRARRHFTVDATGPVIQITDGPADASPDPSVTFEFSAHDRWSDVAGVQCALHDTSVAGDFVPCSGGTTSHSGSVGPGGASNGRYIFSVRATDSLGNTTTVSRSWTVTRMPTAVSLGVDKTRRKVKASGVLRENWEDERGRIGDATVTTTLFKKKKGRFAKLASKNDVTERNGRYTTSFKRPKAGTCKLTTKHRMNELRRASKQTKTFKC